jgi:hypothetical protein
MPFEDWKRRLHGERVPAFLTPTAADEGYYRKPTGFHREPNGRNKPVTWTPVALFVEGDKLVGLIGAGQRIREMTAEELNDESAWSWIVGNPISWALYKKVAEEGGKWPEDEAPVLPERVLSENVGAVEEIAQEKPAAPVTAADHKKLILMAISAAEGAKVTDDAEASLVAGHANRLAELRLAADKAGKAEYKPPFDLYKAKYAEWHPLVDLAETEEKRLNRLILSYRERERQRVLKEEQEAQLKRDQEAAEAQRAADRAIANGEPPSAAELPLEPTNDPVPEVTPLKPIVASYGKRKVREEVKIFADITDQDQVYHHFKGLAEVQILLKTLATAAIRAGRTVPGATKKEGLIDEVSGN